MLDGCVVALHVLIFCLSFRLGLELLLDLMEQTLGFFHGRILDVESILRCFGAWG